jgi:hypothetical protein
LHEALHESAGCGDSRNHVGGEVQPILEFVTSKVLACVFEVLLKLYSLVGESIRVPWLREGTQKKLFRFQVHQKHVESLKLSHRPRKLDDAASLICRLNRVVSVRESDVCVHYGGRLNYWRPNIIEGTRSAHLLNRKQISTRLGRIAQHALIKGFLATLGWWKALEAARSVKCLGRLFYLVCCEVCMSLCIYVLLSVCHSG